MPILGSKKTKGEADAESETSKAPSSGSPPHHKSNLANMIDPRVDYNAPPSSSSNPPPEGYTTTTTTTTYTTHDPHASHLANKLDPRVDSAADSSAAQNRPDIPPRSEMRGARSPNRLDASQPHTQPPASTTAGQNFSRPMGTREGVKAAVAGVHGAGETLRGTLNSSVDRTFREPPEVRAKHDAVADAGMKEISSGQLNDHTKGREGGKLSSWRKPVASGVVVGEGRGNNGRGLERVDESSRML